MHRSYATEIRLVRSGEHDTPVLVLSGELDHDSASQLEEALRENVSDSAPCVMLDLSDLHYVDSGGIAVFSRLLRGLEAQGWVGMIGVNERVRRVFVITGLASHPRLRFFSSQEDAVCGLREPWLGHRN